MPRAAPSPPREEVPAAPSHTVSASQLVKVNCQLRAELQRRLKVYAAERGLKLQDVFDEALDTYLIQRGH